jgi:hypothetical protein
LFQDPKKYFEDGNRMGIFTGATVGAVALFIIVLGLCLYFREEKIYFEKSKFLLKQEEMPEKTEATQGTRLEPAESHFVEVKPEEPSDGPLFKCPVVDGIQSTYNEYQSVVIDRFWIPKTPSDTATKKLVQNVFAFSKKFCTWSVKLEKNKTVAEYNLLLALHPLNSVDGSGGPWLFLPIHDTSKTYYGVNEKVKDLMETRFYQLSREYLDLFSDAKKTAILEACSDLLDNIKNKKNSTCFDHFG